MHSGLTLNCMMGNFSCVCCRLQTFFNLTHTIIIRFLINVQVEGHHPHQWAPFQVTGQLHA